MRYSRNYELQIQTDLEQAIVIKPPFNIVFSADKSVDKSLNKMNIKVYGLSLSNQLAVVKGAQDKKNFIASLKAGYLDNIELVFSGYVNIAERVRENAELPLILECVDGGFDARFSFTSKTIRNKSAIDAILEDMPNTQKGKITEQQKLVRPRVLVGNSWYLIKENTNNEQYFIDDGKLNIINKNEVIDNLIPVVESATGLISTPAKKESQITFTTMMNPSLKVGGLCQLKSVYASYLNGVYKITTISYNGDYEGTNWQQNVTCELTNDYKVL